MPAADFVGELAAEDDGESAAISKHCGYDGIVRRDRRLLSNASAIDRAR